MLDLTFDLTPVGPGMTVDDYINGGGGMSEPEDTVGVWHVEVVQGDRVRFHIDHQSFTLEFIGGDEDITDRAYAEWMAKQLRVALARLGSSDAIRAAVEAERMEIRKMLHYAMPAEGVIRKTLLDLDDSIQKRGAA